MSGLELTDTMVLVAEEEEPPIVEEPEIEEEPEAEAEPDEEEAPPPVQYIVASVPGCGGRMVVQMLEKATGLPHCNEETQDWTDRILHTHSPDPWAVLSVKGENRTVLVRGHLGDAFCAVYERRIGWRKMFSLCHVYPEYQAHFETLAAINPIDAWAFMIDGDKLRWREIIGGWRDATWCYELDYVDFSLYPKERAEALSDYFGVEIIAPPVRPRLSDWRRLPECLRQA